MEIMKTVFAAFGAAMVIYLFVKSIWKKLRKKGSTEAGGQKKLKIGTMNLVLIIMGVSILLFVLKMIQLFETYMAVPDTLITCFFAVCGGEAGILGWIKTTNTRNTERKWQLEDMERMKAEENAPQ